MKVKDTTRKRLNPTFTLFSLGYACNSYNSIRIIVYTETLPVEEVQFILFHTYLYSNFFSVKVAEYSTTHTFPHLYSTCSIHTFYLQIKLYPMKTST